MKKDNKGRNLQKGERQLKTGRYEYRYTDTNGQSHSIYSWRLTDTDVTPPGKKESMSLRKQEAKIIEQLSRNVNYYVTEKTTMGDVFDRFLECSLVKETTKTTYDRKYRLYIADFFDNRTIGSITKSDVMKWLSSLEHRNLSETSINDNFMFLKSILNFAVNDDLLEKNPAHKIKIRQDKKQDKRKALTVEEQNLVMSGVRQSGSVFLRRITEILIETGLRISEMIALTWKDIDFKKNQITISKSAFYGKLHGETSVHSHIVTPKTKTSNRIIPMTVTVRSVFKEMYDEQTLKGFCNTEIDGYKGFIFFTSNGNLLTRAYVNLAYDLFVKKYNRHNPNECMPHLHPHIFRHTFVTRAIEAGVSPKTISVLVGHADVTITLRVYTSVTEENKRTSIDVIEKYMESICA